MATIKSYTDIEQSKKLAEILPLESADMGYLWNGTSFCDYPVSNQIIFNRIENIPCWSLAALLSVLPDYRLSSPNPLDSMYCCRVKDIETYANNPIDACVEMIIRLYELKIL